MIYLITGVPGAGKTLYAISMLEKFRVEGRPIFTDIDGYSSPAAPDDWRTLESGSVVCYDEAQRRWPSVSKARGKELPDVLREMDTHRHLGVDIMIITQAPSYIDVHIRRLVGQHIHLSRVHGFTKSKVYRRDSLIENPLSASQLKQCEASFFSFPKDLYPLYNSAEQHTHKAYVPSYAKYYGVVALLALCGFIYSVPGSLKFWDNSFHSSSNNSVSSSNVPGSVNSQGFSSSVQSVFFSPRDAPVLLEKLDTRACIYNKVKCLCYDQSGKPVSIPLSDCDSVVSHVPIRLSSLPDKI